jgi:ribosomal protein S18 acetylase RimI-like enzyme
MSELSAQYIVERVDPTDVTYDLTSELQAIALRGWQQSLPHRTDEELRSRFNPDDIPHLTKVREIYSDFAAAKTGGLLIARSVEGSEPLGFALLHEDISGNPLARLYKRVTGHGVYAHIQHVCTDRPGQGIGRALLTEGLQGFKEEIQPTAYVFDENVAAKAFFSKLGFKPTEKPQEPGKTRELEPSQRIDEYFKGGEPVYQIRFVGDSVESTMHILGHTTTD